MKKYDSLIAQFKEDHFYIYKREEETFFKHLETYSFDSTDPENAIEDRLKFCSDFIHSYGEQIIVKVTETLNRLHCPALKLNQTQSISDYIKESLLNFTVTAKEEIQTYLKNMNVNLQISDMMFVKHCDRPIEIILHKLQREILTYNTNPNTSWIRNRQTHVIGFILVLIGVLLTYYLTRTPPPSPVDGSNGGSVSTNSGIVPPSNPDSQTTNTGQSKEDSVPIPPNKSKSGYFAVGKDTFGLLYNNDTIGYILLPNSVQEFYLYEQNRNSQKPEDCRNFRDQNEIEIGYMDREEFLSKLAGYINLSNSRNKRIIISANEPDLKNDWRGNPKIKFGNDKTKLTVLKQSKYYNSDYEKSWVIQGWINYKNVP